MGKSKKLDTTCAPTKKNKLAAKNAVARKSATKRPASVSLQKAIPELEREVTRIAELESDPMLRAILAGRIILTADEIADSIENGFLEGKVIYDSNGAPDPVRSIITANELPRFLDFIRRSLEETKVLYLEQHNIEACPASINLGCWSAVAHDVGSVEDWGYWCRLKYLTPMEASCLLVTLDPDSYANIKTHNTPQVNELGKYVVRLERHAERDNEGKKLSAAKWIEWAQGKGYAVPKEFDKAVKQFEEEKRKTDAVGKSQATAPEVETPATNQQKTDSEEGRRAKEQEEAERKAKEEAENKTQEEMIHNAHVGNWDYWASIACLTPREIACLLMEINPKKEIDFFKSCDDPQYAALAKWVEDIEHAATREQDTKTEKLSPANWIAWAQGNGMAWARDKGCAVPEKFVEAVKQFEKQKPKTRTVEQSQGVAPKMATSEGEPRTMKKPTAKELGQITINAFLAVVIQRAAKKETPFDKTNAPNKAGFFSAMQKWIKAADQYRSYQSIGTFDEHRGDLVHFGRGRPRNKKQVFYMELFPELSKKLE